MSITGEMVVAAARGLIGVPFIHQGRDRKLGFDCVGALALTADALGVPHTDDLTYPLKANQSGIMRRIMIESGCVAIPVDLERHGDILTFWYQEEGIEYHAGFLATDRGRPTVIHSLPHRGMVEHGINAFWRHRIMAQFVPPGVEVPA